MTTEDQRYSRTQYLGIGEAQTKRFSDDVSSIASAGSLNTSSGDESSGGSRKPSYVGLSCTVSGYAGYNRYTSPSRKTSPSQIPVSSNPQTLDSVSLVLSQANTMRQQERPVRGQEIAADCPDNRGFFPSTHSRTLITQGELTSVETVTKFYKEGSPDSGKETTPPPSGGNLVQKQIERLYGGKIQSVRMTSPEPRDDDDEDTTPKRKISGGFFAKRFGVSKQKERRTPTSNLEAPNGNGSPTMEFKPLKVPAVFRLLRPEFREQLKSHSCQVNIPSESEKHVKERIVPIRRENGSTPTNGSSQRIIPIQRENGQHSESPKERIIPIQKETDSVQQAVQRERPIPVSLDTSKRSPVKPAIPAKPTSPTRGRPTPPTSPTGRPILTTPTHNVTSPSLVANCFKESSAKEEELEKKREIDKILDDFSKIGKEIEDESQKTNNNDLKISLTNGSANHHIEMNDPRPEADRMFQPPEYVDEEEEEEELDDYDRFHATSPPCGLRERELLGTILEEDNESTASGSSLATPRTIKFPAPIPVEEPVEEEFLSPPKEVKDGHYYIKVLENEIFKFEEQICDFEEELNDPTIPEWAKDSIFAANGKARLLMSQKLTQFRGLCDKNITLNAEEDPFVPTSDDLTGFWEMVYIQVEHIHSLFAELNTLRDAGWKQPQQQTNGVKKPAPTRKAPAKKPASGTKKPLSEAQKARDEARKKMLEEKKRMMKQKQKQNNDSDIFIVM